MTKISEQDFDRMWNAFSAIVAGARTGKHPYTVEEDNGWDESICFIDEESGVYQADKDAESFLNHMALFLGVTRKDVDAAIEERGKRLIQSAKEAAR